MKQRLLSICTALCLCLTLLPAAAWANGGTIDPGGGSGESDPQSSAKVGSWDELQAAIGDDTTTDISLRCDISRIPGGSGGEVPPKS